MRQPVDERHISSKMVGRKEALEVQCNGITNHVQTRFTCTKGDRENLGGIFIDERLTAAQLRKKRSISVSCKDLLEIGSGAERTHYLRSGRPARSELSQLSPALSDNSHPLLNSNSNQPLLSPTLSERGHNLRPRSQLWSNVIEEDSLLATANNHSEKTIDKADKGDKSDKVDKPEKSAAQEDSNDFEVGDVKDCKDRELRPPHNHNRNRSIRRKRLSAEEKLIEDNRGYYKVEVLNSKLRSTGYFLQQLNQSDVSINGSCVTNGPTRSGSQEEKEPVVVRFKKVRRSELSVLSDEAENFMFGEQTKSESNSDNLSESEEEEEDGEEDEDDYEDDEGGDDDEGGGTDSNGINENGTDSNRSRSSQRNGRRSSSAGNRGRDLPHRLKIKVGNYSTYTRCNAVESSSSSQANSSESNGYRKCRKRRSQAEAFITDNMDYYKFEMAGSRLRVHGSPNTTGDVEDSPNQEKSKFLSIEEIIPSQVVDSTPCPVDDLHFSFETIPSSEVWFQTFQRQDRGEELFFPSVGEPSSVVLPYQIPRRDLHVNQRGQLGRRRNKSFVRLPRKSPRCHASTLAILSSVVKRRSSREPEKGNPTEPPLVEVVQVESKSSGSKHPQPSTSASDQQLVHSSKEDVADEEEIQEIARSIDSMLGLVPSSSSDFEKDQDSSQSKPCSKGRGRKKQAVKSMSSNVVSVPENVLDTNDRDKDPSLNYLVDPAVLEELACTCDVVSDPRGGPTMDILSLLDSYSDCCCIDDSSSAELGVDASCNSSECGTSSTCEADRRLKKKRKRRNMTGWDKPKRRCILRRDVLGAIPEQLDALKDCSSRDTPSKDSLEESDPLLNSTDSDSNVHKVPNSISSPTQNLKRKCASKRKLRSSLSLTDSSRKSNIPVQSRINVMKIERDGEVTMPSKKGKSRKLRRLGWSKAR